MPAAIVTRKIGQTVELSYRDVALFSQPRARAVLARLGRVFFALALQEIAGRISDEAPVGVSGHLAQSWAGGSGFGNENGGIELMGQEIGSLQGRVFSSLPYAIVMDEGRRPGARMPPVDALMLWVERTFGIPRGFDDDELERTAWAVARSIQRKGIQARHYVDAGVSAAMPRVDRIFKTLAESIAAELVEAGLTGAGGPVTGGAGGGGLL